MDPHRVRAHSPYMPPVLTAHPTADIWTRTRNNTVGARGYYKGRSIPSWRAFHRKIGYHGCPNVSSIRRFYLARRALALAGEDGWNDEWQVHAVYHWQHRRIDRDRIKLMANQVRELFGVIPEDLESFALASQIVEAEAVKFFIEATRLRKWRTSGILWWNLIDGWPQFSDSVVDYYFGIKLAYHYIRRVQQPVCVIIGEPGPGKQLPVIIANDALQPVEVDYRITAGGEVVSAGQFVAPANQNWQVDHLRVAPATTGYTWLSGAQAVCRQPLSGRSAAVLGAVPRAGRDSAAAGVRRGHSRTVRKIMSLYEANHPAIILAIARYPCYHAI